MSYLPSVEICFLASSEDAFECISPISSISEDAFECIFPISSMSSRYCEQWQFSSAPFRVLQLLLRMAFGSRLVSVYRDEERETPFRASDLMMVSFVKHTLRTEIS